MAAGEAGFDVVVHTHHPDDAAAEVVGRIEALGRQAAAMAADLADPAACASLIADAPSPLTLLVNSASVFAPDDAQGLEAAAFDMAVAINLRAPVLLASAMARALPKGVAGHIVNILDQRVWRLTPLYFSYTLSKSALWTATQTLAQGLAPAVRVNAIGPGPTLASIHQSAEGFAAQAAAAPLGAGPTPQDIAAALTYLIDARSVTGQMIAVDGGQHLAWRTPDVAHD
jgi:NAD(P)-dependent dehydrogenase (short-subunit alcohol dehydrogenase family)